MDWWDAQLLASGTFERGEFRALEFEVESIEGWTDWLADSLQSAVGLAERVLVMHFSRCARLVPPATAHLQQLT